MIINFSPLKTSATYTGVLFIINLFLQIIICIGFICQIFIIHFFKFCWLSWEVFKTLFSASKEEGISFFLKYLLLILFI